MAKRHQNPLVEMSMQITKSNGLFVGQSGANSKKDPDDGQDEVVLNVGEEIITPEIQAKLDDYDSMFAQHSTLLAEKDELTMKLAQYIEENVQLKSNNRNNVSKDQFDELQRKYDLLSKANQELQAQFDKQLEKNASLTFELAALKSQKKQKTSTGSEIAITNSIPEKPIRDTKLESAPFNPYKTNGYSSWN